MSAFIFTFLTAILGLFARALTLDEEDLQFSGTELLERVVDPCLSVPECDSGLIPIKPVPQIISISGWNNSAWSAQTFFTALDPRVLVPTLMAHKYLNDIV